MQACFFIPVCILQADKQRQWETAGAGKHLSLYFQSKQERSPSVRARSRLPPEGEPASGEGEILYIFLIKHYIFINVQLVHCILRVGVCGGVFPPPHATRLVPLMCLVWQAGIVL